MLAPSGTVIGDTVGKKSLPKEQGAVSKPRVKVEIDRAGMKRVAEQATQAVADHLQSVLDRVFDEYAGQPVEVIKPVLAEQWASAMPGAHLTDPHLTSIAQAISNGQRVELRG